MDLGESSEDGGDIRETKIRSETERACKRNKSSERKWKREWILEGESEEVKAGEGMMRWICREECKALGQQFPLRWWTGAADRMNNLGWGVDIDPTMHFCVATMSQVCIYVETLTQTELCPMRADLSQTQYYYLTVIVATLFSLHHL